jgi:hypothetical protein
MLAQSERKLASPAAAYLALGQGLFYLATGVWPLVSVRTFQLVTGPKLDLWLVKTVGLLVGVIGGVLAWAGTTRRVSPELAALAAGSAASLAGVDVAYVAKKRISPVYLLDAAAETALVAAWAAALWKRGEK